MERIWDAIVVGGGCAGLSCATTLAERGYRVLVLEKKPYLGGRTSSFTDKVSGETVDHGQHLFLGCYHETKKYLHRIGSLKDLFFWNSFQTPLYGKDGSRHVLRTSTFPAPFHTLMGILAFGALSWKERFSVCKVALAAKFFKKQTENKSVQDWLKELSQSDATIERFWDPLVLATLNIESKLAPAHLLAVVLDQGFMQKRSDSFVGLSRVGLTELIGVPAKTYLESRHGEVRLRQRVQKLLFSQGLATGVMLEDGGALHAKCVVSAVPPNVLQPWMPDADFLNDLFSSPILSLHLWLENPPFEDVFVGFWGTTFHWAFQRKKILKDPGTSHVTFVISSAFDVMKKTKDELVALALEELKLVTDRTLVVKRALVTKEPEATWVPAISASILRVSPKKQWNGMYVCGDWTDTGLPGTIEGAVKSGHLCAQAVIRDRTNLTK